MGLFTQGYFEGAILWAGYFDGRGYFFLGYLDGVPENEHRISRVSLSEAIHTIYISANEVDLSDLFAVPVDKG